LGDKTTSRSRLVGAMVGGITGYGATTLTASTDRDRTSTQPGSYEAATPASTYSPVHR
jgi:hypothetical protein